MFPENLKKARKAKKLSQADLAEAVNMSQASVTMWEAGSRKPNIDTLKLLSKVLDCPLDELMDDGEQKEISLSDERAEKLNDFVDLFEKLSPEQQGFILSSMRGLLTTP